MSQDRFSIARRYYKEILVRALRGQDAEEIAEAIHDLITAEIDALRARKDGTDE